MPRSYPPTHPHTVLRINVMGEDEVLNHRLMQMGILPGTELTVVRSGAFGGPVELAADLGQSIAMRKSDLQSIHWDVVALPLSAVQRVSPPDWRVLRLAGGRRFQQHFRQMGIVAGVEFTLMGLAPIRIRIASTSVHVGRGEAERLIVEPVRVTT
ncbi:MAG: ferrous iron transport protein A [Chromatiales bacterium]|nr:ferrous iron transport protein A [Chromatiales bacterium]